MMTPEEFLTRMKELADREYVEIEHETADALLCEVLTSLGYGEGVKVYNAMPKWHD